jgi:hypothetical protein
VIELIRKSPEHAKVNKPQANNRIKCRTNSRLSLEGFSSKVKQGKPYICQLLKYLYKQETHWLYGVI